MRNWPFFVYACFLFSLGPFQGATAAGPPKCTEKQPPQKVCAINVCLGDNEWDQQPRPRGTACRDAKGVAGICDGADADCSIPCPDENAFVAPKYYVLSLIYSPPGCTSTATYTCPGVGQVDYGQGASLSTKITKSSSYAEAFTFSVDATLEIPFAKVFKLKLGGGASTGWGTTNTDANSQTISTSGSLDIKVNGNNDGVDHDQDQFFLLLNPAVALRASAPDGSSLEGCSPTQRTWQVGLFGSQTLETYALSVSQLKNPQSLPPNVADVLKAHGLTESDFADILALDPFAQGQTAIDTDRYAATTYSFPYQPPPTGGSCTGGTCSCLAFVEAIKNDFQGAHTSTAQSYKDVGFNESAGVEGPVGKDLFSATVKSTQKWTWSNSSSTENDTDNSQSASLTITCASPAYTNPTDATEMLVYFDRIFGTFLFVPTLSVASQRPIHQGFLTRGGEAAAHVPVQLTVDGKTYHTFTNNSGGYVFYGPAAAIQRGTLSVGGQAFELPLTPTMPAAVEIR